MVTKEPLAESLLSPQQLSTTSTSLLLPTRNDADTFETNKILSLDAITLSNAIRVERSVTCEQLMKATLDRIDAINPEYNAIILLRDREALLSEARSYDQKLENYHSNEQLGWLHGIPMAIKDVSNAEGLPTTMGGSPLFCGDSGDELEVAAFSDPYVENIVREGAIIIGKTNAPEGGLGSNTFNQKWGKTLNPFAVTTTPVDTTNLADVEQQNISAGGSSGGAAVAVATRMLALADGTDNMGSLRNPAGWNNIYSLRPTAGLIPSSLPTREATNNKDDPLYGTNKFSAASTILPHPASTPGPMARTPLDCARLLQTLVGDSEKCDMRSLWNSIAQTNTKSKTDSDTHGLNVRIGWLGNWGDRLPMEDGILATCQKALESWSNSSSAGGNTKIVVKAYPSEETPLFDSDKLWEGYNTIRFASTYERYSQNFDVEHLLSKAEEGETLMKKELVWELMQGRSIDSKALHRARIIYDEYEEWLSKTFSQSSKSDDSSYDFLALPSAQVWPFPIEDRYPKNIDRTPMDTYHRWMEVCVPVSFGGLPCVTIPAGFGRNQLPIGIQLFGKKGDDLKLLRLADDYHHHYSQQGTK